MPRDGVMECSRGLRGVSVVAEASWRLHEAFVEPPWLLAAPPWSLREAFAMLWRPPDTIGIRQIMTGLACGTGFHVLY